MGTTGVRVQAFGERYAEITLGKAYFQQGLVATCKDWHFERKHRVAEDPGLAHECVGAMRAG